ncbi:MAG: hypothetical protein CL930_05180 [Deltaproteobacteria bacterium]|mgnify:CR=1 FL=1|nr:hypothetical protein [Deltaproteobacteria bacterium]
MIKSAHVVALLLIALNQPAFGDTLVVAEEDGTATAPQEVEPVFGPVTSTEAALVSEPVGSDGINETDEFQRLFGAQQGGLPQNDKKIVDEAKTAAWPWWSWPLGLFAIGVLLIIRGRVTKASVQKQAMTVVARQDMGKEGTLALIELADGDSRTRRLLVGLGGGAPRLVADVSAWEVAVAAPSNIANDAVAMVGPDPDESTMGEPQDASKKIALVPKSFATHMSQANGRYTSDAVQTPKEAPASPSRLDLIEEVLAVREQVRNESVAKTNKGRSRKPAYSSREIVA